MPQLMPLGWVLSVFMVVYMLIMSSIFYYKSLSILEIKEMKELSMNFNWMW